MRIALAEDGALFRESLVLLLRAAGHEVVHCTADGDELAALLADDPVDVAVLDIRMPPGPEGGLQTAGRLRSVHPAIGLLLLSHHAEARYLTRMLEIGPDSMGYRLKDRLASIGALGDTLARIADGETVIEPSLASRLINARERRGAFAALTPQEMEVLQLMAAGRSNAGIAEELAVSRRAVEKQVGAVFSKLSLPPAAAVHHRRVLAVLRFLRDPVQPMHPGS